VGSAHAAGPNKQQILACSSPGVAAGQYLQAPANRLASILLPDQSQSSPFCPGQMKLPQEALVPCQLT